MNIEVLIRKDRKSSSADNSIPAAETCESMEKKRRASSSITDSDDTDSIPTPNPFPQTQQRESSMPNASSRVLETSSSEVKKSTLLNPINNDEPGNMGSLKSMMAVLHEDKALDPSRLNVRKQSEILSKIPPFNLFVRNFEELTTSKTENMLLNFEARIMDSISNVEKRINENQTEIMDRLDSIETRLGVLEQSLNSKKLNNEEVQKNSMEDVM